MPFQVHFDEEIKCVIVTLNGVLDMQLLKSLAADVAKLSREKSCKRILNDMRGVVLEKRAVEIYNMPSAVQKEGIERSYRRALVVGDDLSQFRFLETVFLNQGSEVKLFSRMEDAREWLAE